MVLVLIALVLLGLAATVWLNRGSGRLPKFYQAWSDDYDNYNKNG